MNEEKISGNIWARSDKFYPEGENYIIRNPVTRQGWGLPVDSLQPDDLRVLADRVEERRKA